MKSYQLIHQLLDIIDKLEVDKKGQGVSMNDLTGFLLAFGASNPEDNVTAADIRFGKKENQAQEQAYQLDNNIGRLFVYMSRYAKSYIKKALDGTPLQTAEDFTCLAILLTHDSLSKSELIKSNLQEKTSGTEVIRRLISAELVAQWDDTDDKRSKRVAITNTGKELLYLVFDDMNDVGKMITGNLSYAEILKGQDRKSTRLNSSHSTLSRMPSSA